MARARETSTYLVINIKNKNIVPIRTMFFVNLIIENRKISLTKNSTCKFDLQVLFYIIQILYSLDWNSRAVQLS